ncbi:hypothetical protein GSY74_08945 [Sulfurovum sp. bin170]|uniref:hypothetical protein n=1 Tax=Sulfurovum sp. bin170 TaxID=2695268 RepID=UPI0013E0D1B8|nr:hypothetical protein [Sulfurovum sp. bin170]NEW61408.1 hypothetical protein [Sulfurovum sp. bin170]
MQLLINIPDSLANKIIQILNVFKSDGLEIVRKIDRSEESLPKYSDEYIEKNWKELIMTIKSDTDYHKSEQYQLDRGEYLMEKYK